MNKEGNPVGKFAKKFLSNGAAGLLFTNGAFVPENMVGNMVSGSIAEFKQKARVIFRKGK